MGTNKVTEFGLEMYRDKYFLEGEDYDGLVKRVCDFNSDTKEHSERLQKYWKDLWFHPSTPVTSNSGTDRGQLISCFLNEVPDNKKGIFNVYTENNWLGSGGGGIGTDWSRVREIGANVGKNGQSSGVVPFVKVSDSSTLAVSQGGLRRASQAVYLDTSHPEIEEFIDLRRPTGADSNRRCLNVHHGVKLSDNFMQAVLDDTDWNLISPSSGEVVKTLKAFDLFKKMLLSRVETGEPYMFFSDTARRYMPKIYKMKALEVTMSNLCTEIMLSTSPKRTAVCCLASLNLETYFEWNEDELFIEDVTRFLDNVLSNFIGMAYGTPGYEKSVASATHERSIGIGVMGFAGLLQSKLIPWESSLASGLNREIFRNIQGKTDAASLLLALEKGSAPIFQGTNIIRRNTCTMAIAPTSSISILCGESTAGVDPILTNIYTHKNGVGSHVVYNKHLYKHIDKHALKYHLTIEWCTEQWKSIAANQGSVQHLEWMNDWDKDVFKTAYELDQSWIIEHASIRQPYVDQGQSVNLFFTHDTQVQKLFSVHVEAWKKGLKSLYYCRSTASSRANVGHKVERKVIEETPKYDVCLSCQ